MRQKKSYLGGQFFRRRRVEKAANEGSFFVFFIFRKSFKDLVLYEPKLAAPISSKQFFGLQLCF